MKEDFLLPQDILLLIFFGFCTINDIKSIRLVCRAWNSLILEKLPNPYQSTTASSTPELMKKTFSYYFQRNTQSETVFHRQNFIKNGVVAFQKYLEDPQYKLLLLLIMSQQPKIYEFIRINTPNVYQVFSNYSIPSSDALFKNTDQYHSHLKGYSNLLFSQVSSIFEGIELQKDFINSLKIKFSSLLNALFFLNLHNIEKSISYNPLLLVICYVLASDLLTIDLLPKYELQDDIFALTDKSLFEESKKYQLNKMEIAILKSLSPIEFEKTRNQIKEQLATLVSFATVIKKLSGTSVWAVEAESAAIDELLCDGNYYAFIKTPLFSASFQSNNDEVIANFFKENYKKIKGKAQEILVLCMQPFLLLDSYEVVIACVQVAFLNLLPNINFKTRENFSQNKYFTDVNKTHNTHSHESSVQTIQSRSLLNLQIISTSVFDKMTESIELIKKELLPSTVTQSLGP